MTKLKSAQWNSEMHGISYVYNSWCIVIIVIVPFTRCTMPAVASVFFSRTCIARQLHQWWVVTGGRSFWSPVCFGCSMIMVETGKFSSLPCIPTLQVQWTDRSHVHMILTCNCKHANWILLHSYRTKQSPFAYLQISCLNLTMETWGGFRTRTRHRWWGWRCIILV